MEFLKYIWRPIDGLIFFDCDMERWYPATGETKIAKTKLCGLPIGEHFSYRWTKDNQGIDQFCNVSISHTPTGHLVGMTSTVEAAQVLVDTILLEADKKIDWDSTDVDHFRFAGKNYLPKDFKDYAFWMTDTTEPVSYKDWKKSNG